MTATVFCGHADAYTVYLQYIITIATIACHVNTDFTVWTQITDFFTYKMTAQTVWMWKIILRAIYFVKSNLCSKQFV